MSRKSRVASPKSGAPAPSCDLRLATLLPQLDRGAGDLQGLLRLFGSFLVHTLEHRSGRPVRELLCLPQAQAGEVTNLLDHLYLLLADFGEHDVVFVLLFVGGFAIATTGGGCG